MVPTESSWNLPTGAVCTGVVSRGVGTALALPVTNMRDQRSSDVSAIMADARLADAATSRCSSNLPPQKQGSAIYGSNTDTMGCRALKDAARWKKLHTAKGARSHNAAERASSQAANGRKQNQKNAREGQTQGSKPPIMCWSKKLFPRPQTPMNWGDNFAIRPPTAPASEWSNAWTAALWPVSRPSDLEDEETTFLVNPGRHFLASSDVTSPRCTRRAFGLRTDEFYAFVEPLKTPPSARGAMLTRRHGGVERTRGKHDQVTCQMGYGLIEHSERSNRNLAIVEQRMLAADPRPHQSRISLLDLETSKKKVLKPAVKPSSPPRVSGEVAARALNIPGQHKRNSRWSELVVKQM